MSTPVTKKRRIDLAASALSRPFRSPFKTQSAVENSTQDAQQPQDSRAAAAHLYTSPSQPHSMNLITALSLSVGLDRRQRYGSSSLRPMAVSNTDIAIAPILKSQRQLENKLRELKEELHTTRQAKKIETDSLKHKSCGAEIDGELIALARRWKTASRQAAEELFGGVKDRVNRYAAQRELMGGPRAWKEMQHRQMEFRQGFNEEPLQTDSQDEEEGDGKMTDIYAECDIETETENEIEARGGNNISDDDGDGDEFTMSMMLKTLNIDLSIIGYDKEYQRWMD